MTTTVYTTPKEILVADQQAFTISIRVGNAGLSADSDGKKILLAGTPLKGTADANILQVRNTVAIKEDGSNAKMVLMHDVDVTAGTVNGTGIVSGVIDLNKCGYSASSTAQTALARIIFMKGE